MEMHKDRMEVACLYRQLPLYSRLENLPSFFVIFFGDSFVACIPWVDFLEVEKKHVHSYEATY